MALKPTSKTVDSQTQPAPSPLLSSVRFEEMALEAETLAEQDALQNLRGKAQRHLIRTGRSQT